jgi:5'-nucleotidase
VPYSLHDKLVIAVASSALFDLSESDAVFQERGLEEYRAHQRRNEAEVLAPGVAFPLVKRLLGLNGPEEKDRIVEVILLSRNDPDTGNRVMRSIQVHGLDISRAAFVNGKTPFRYLKAYNAALFLSANANDVREAVMRGAPAGQVLPSAFSDVGPAVELRVAFDFDGILADDAAELVFKADGLAAFHAHEAEHGSEPMQPGPLHRFFTELARLQAQERSKRSADPGYEPRIRTAIITARNAPAHERVVSTLRSWGIEVDEVFFLGGIDKALILEEFRPHIFFDDQLSHVHAARAVVPSVHVPFGISNVPPTEADVEAAMEEAKQRHAGAQSGASVGAAQTEREP